MNKIPVGSDDVFLSKFSLGDFRVTQCAIEERGLDVTEIQVKEQYLRQFVTELVNECYSPTCPEWKRKAGFKRMLSQAHEGTGLLFGVSVVGREGLDWPSTAIVKLILSDLKTVKDINADSR